MIIWIFLSVLVAAEVSRAAGKCFRNDFEGELIKHRACKRSTFSDSN